MAVIEVSNLKYKYPHTDELVLDDVSFSVEKGEFIGIIGRNGAGKSTLSQALIGLVPQFYKGAYGGRVSINIGNETFDASTYPISEMCQHVGLVFQNPFNQLSGATDTVYNEVAFGLMNLGIKRDEMKRRIEEILKLLDIWEYRDRNPFDLSGGQMQRVAIASILVMQPEVLILDEPTSQLDPQGAEEVFKAVERLSDTGITIIMIEQKMEKLARYCDRLILLNHGKIIAYDRPDIIFARDDLKEMGIVAPSGDIKVRQKSDIKNKECIFDIDNISFSYTENTPIISGLSLKLYNEATAIIGQNGAGKTTLVRLLKGLLRLTGGKILFEGMDISLVTVASLSDRIGYVFQNPDDQIFKYDVLSEVMFGPLNIGMSKEQAREESLKAIELMGLKGKEEKNPYDLELYERKMIAIASIVAMNTKVIILDEPTIAQDAEGRERISNMIRQMTKEGRLVIAILHDMEFVAENFDRIIEMKSGKVIADGDCIA